MCFSRQDYSQGYVKNMILQQINFIIPTSGLGCVSLFPTIQGRLRHCVKDFDLVVTTHTALQSVYSKMKR